MQLLLPTYLQVYVHLCSVKSPKEILKNYKTEIIGGTLGAIAGLAYWFFVGCESGTCAITSSPLNSTLYGTVMGVLAAGIFQKDKSNKTNQQKNQG